MGSSKKTTVGYWYPLAIRFGLGGPIDAFLQLRGGDRAAWQGELTSPGTINVDALELWGGEDGEGGMQGAVDIDFGTADQQPNAYCAGLFGEDSGYRSMSTVTWKGGKYGAFNPYPKAAAFLVRSIKAGWPDGEAWYSETASINVSGGGSVNYIALAIAESIVIPTRTGSDWTDSALSPEFVGSGITASADRYLMWSESRTAVSGADAIDWTYSDVALGSEGGTHQGGYFDSKFIIAVGSGGIVVSEDDGQTFRAAVDAPWANWLGIGESRILCVGSGSVMLFGSASVDGPWVEGVDLSNMFSTGNNIFLEYGEGEFRIGGKSNGGGARVANCIDEAQLFEMTLPAASDSPISGMKFAPSYGWIAATESGVVIYDEGDGWLKSDDELPGKCNAMALVNGKVIAVGDGYIATIDGGGVVSVLRSDSNKYTGIASIGSGNADLWGMNPAHVLYRRMRAKGEPLSSINDASFRAAADVFYSEGFGICTTFNHTSEDHDDFVTRICNVSGSNLSRSRVNGQWYLDPVRGGYDIDTLPILTDADILEWGEEPSVLDDAVNQVTVEWFDPASKESRTTAPVQSLGAIQSAGTINAQTNSYPEIPSESLALRLAARDLQSTATPLRKFPLTCGRTPYAWRKGSRFRLQCPLRGIADMVCIVGEIDVGTLRSGSIALTAVQDVFGMPATTYVVAEPGVDTSPITTPSAAPWQLLFETPYRDLAQVLTATELAALSADAGYLAFVAQRPGNALNYTLATAAEGEDYAESALADWCPTATVQDAGVAELGPTAVTLIDGDELSWVVVGTAALWDDEIVRVDAIDTVTGVCTLARGCVDTVPADHAAGARIWFYDSYAAGDEREYVSGETAHAKALSRTGSAKLALAAAPASDVVLNERANRPYPPGLLSVNSESWPSNAWGELSLMFADRDRKQQADKLIDTTLASIGPEVGTTYTARWYLDGDLIQTDEAISSAGAICSPSRDGSVRIEIDAVRDGLVSWRSLRHTFAYTIRETVPYTRITPAGDTRVTSTGDRRIVRLPPTT